MCGISGFLMTGQIAAADQGNIRKMTTILKHRGPDGFGYYVNQKNGLAMGHARLSIIDLETGDQPLFNNNKKHIFTGNGEFYDYKSIRAELTCDGARFSTKSDSEIALHLYQRKGLEFIHDLRGEFAFALFDQNKNRLILARDRFGIKPLFYHISASGVYWGSEVKAVLQHPDVERALCPRAILHQMMHTMVPGSSAFKDIHALKPGHMIIIDKKKNGFNIRQHKYWDLNFPHKADYDQRLTENEYIELVREKLLEAVKHRLEADVPVGCYLSGGIDSCSMLGLASAVQQSPVKAYTISFDHDAYDEGAIAKEMAKRVRADQEMLNLNHNDLYGENYIQTVWHAERTFYNTLGVAKWCMSKRVNESGYKVVVTGEGSDELFGGYPAFKRDMIRFGLNSDTAKMKTYREQMEKSNRLFRGAILSEENMSHASFENLCGFTPSWIQPWMQTLQVARPLLNGDLRTELDDYDPVAAIAETFDPLLIEDRHALDIAQYTWSKTMLECQILNWGGDRVDMANSMESRPAFLDHYVAEAAVTIPPDIRIKDNVEKWVLREAMKNILPETLYKREKFAFMAPPAHTREGKRKAVFELIDKYLSPLNIQDAGIFDSSAIETFLKEYKTDQDSVSLVRKDALLNHIICLQVLHDQFIKV